MERKFVEKQAAGIRHDPDEHVRQGNVEVIEEQRAAYSAQVQSLLIPDGADHMYNGRAGSSKDREASIHQSNAEVPFLSLVDKILTIAAGRDRYFAANGMGTALVVAYLAD